MIKLNLYIIITSCVVLSGCESNVTVQGKQLISHKINVEELDTDEDFNLTASPSLECNSSDSDKIIYSNNSISIPLEMLYTDETIALIKKGKNANYAPKLILSFEIMDNNIYWANNDKNKLEKITIGDHKVTTVSDYNLASLGMDDGAINAVECITSLSQNNLFLSSFSNSASFDLNNQHWSKHLNTSFAKSRVNTIRVLDKHKWKEIRLFKYNSIEEKHPDLIFSDTWDAVMHEETEDVFVMSIENEFSIYKSSTNQIKTNIFDGGFGEDYDYWNSDVLILKVNNNRVYFILNDGHLGVYDFSTNQANILTKLKDISPHTSVSGYQGIYRTDIIYKLDEKDLWRLRTTEDAMVFEKWDISNWIVQ